MNVAVLFANTIIQYKKEKCLVGTDFDCIHRIFSGEDYFENFIIKHSSMYSRWEDKDSYDFV